MKSGALVLFLALWSVLTAAFAYGQDGPTVAHATTGRELLSAMADPRFALILLDVDWISLYESDCPPNAPVLITRNLTLRGANSERPTALNLNYLRHKFRMANGTMIRLQHTILHRARAGPASLAVGIDLFAPTLPGEEAIQWMEDGYFMYPVCFNQEAYRVFTTVTAHNPLPPQLPPGNAWEVPAPLPSPPPGGRCRNVSDALAPDGDRSVHPLDRCFLLAVRCLVTSVYGADLQRLSGNAVRNGYLVHMERNTVLCPEVLSDECIQARGPLGCAALWHSMNRLTWMDGSSSSGGAGGGAEAGSPPPPPLLPAGGGGTAIGQRLGSGSSSSADSGGGCGGGGAGASAGAPVAAIAGGIAGAVVGVVVVIAAAAALLIRRRRHLAGGGAAEAHKAGSCWDGKGQPSQPPDAKAQQQQQQQQRQQRQQRPGGEEARASSASGESGCPGTAASTITSSSCAATTPNLVLTASSVCGISSTQSPARTPAAAILETAATTAAAAAAGSNSDRTDAVAVRSGGSGPSSSAATELLLQQTPPAASSSNASPGATRTSTASAAGAAGAATTSRMPPLPPSARRIARGSSSSSLNSAAGAAAGTPSGAGPGAGAGPTGPGPVSRLTPQRRDLATDARLEMSALGQPLPLGVGAGGAHAAAAAEGLLGTQAGTQAAAAGPGAGGVVAAAAAAVEAVDETSAAAVVAGGLMGDACDDNVVRLLPEVLGRGAFGKVYAGTYRGSRVAVKLLMGLGPHQLAAPVPPVPPPVAAELAGSAAAAEPGAAAPAAAAGAGAAAAAGPAAGGPSAADGSGRATAAAMMAVVGQPVAVRASAVAFRNQQQGEGPIDPSQQPGPLAAHHHHQHHHQHVQQQQQQVAAAAPPDGAHAALTRGPAVPSSGGRERAMTLRVAAAAAAAAALLSPPQQGNSAADLPHLNIAGTAADAVPPPAPGGAQQAEAPPPLKSTPHQQQQQVDEVDEEEEEAARHRQMQMKGHHPPPQGEHCNGAAAIVSEEHHNHTTALVAAESTPIPKAPHPPASAPRNPASAAPVPAPAVWYDEEELELFKREVQVLGRLQHPNIVRLIAVCMTPPRLSLVMEAAETSLDKVLYGGGGGGACGAGGSACCELLPLPKVLHIAVQIARGLEYLHPIVSHGDLKPANVLLNGAATHTPTVKLTDFGQAAIRMSTTWGARSSSSSRGGTLGAVGAPAGGTAAFCAPECFDQAGGRAVAVTHKADIYSFAVVLWCMLTGAEPWRGLSAVSIAVQVALRGRSLLSVPQALAEERCPPKLKRLLAECFEQDPRRRPAAAEVVKQLLLVKEQLAHSSSNSKRTPGQQQAQELAQPKLQTSTAVLLPAPTQQQQQQQQPSPRQPPPAAAGALQPAPAARSSTGDDASGAGSPPGGGMPAADVSSTPTATPAAAAATAPASAPLAPDAAGATASSFTRSLRPFRTSDPGGALPPVPLVPLHERMRAAAAAMGAVAAEPAGCWMLLPGGVGGLAREYWDSRGSAAAAGTGTGTGTGRTSTCGLLLPPLRPLRAACITASATADSSSTAGQHATATAAVLLLPGDHDNIMNGLSGAGLSQPLLALAPPVVRTAHAPAFAVGAGAAVRVGALVARSRRAAAAAAAAAAVGAAGAAAARSAARAGAGTGAGAGAGAADLRRVSFTPTAEEVLLRAAPQVGLELCQIDDRACAADSAAAAAAMVVGDDCGGEEVFRKLGQSQKQDAPMPAPPQQGAILDARHTPAAATGYGNDSHDALPTSAATDAATDAACLASPPWRV